MILTLRGFVALLQGLNMLSVAVIQTKEGLGDSVDFRLCDLHQRTPSRIVDGSKSLDLSREPNVVVFRDAQPGAELLKSERTFRLLMVAENCAQNEGNGEGLFSRVDQQFYILCLDRDTLVERYVVNDVYKTNIVASFVEDKQSWNFVEDQFWLRRGNLEGLQLRGLVDGHVPFAKIAETRPLEPPDPHYEEVVKYDGPYGEALRILEKGLNFTTSLRIRRDGMWGIQDSQGNWDGMIRDLLDDTADILPAPFYMTPSRFAAVDFLFPFGHDIMTLFVWTGQGSHGESSWVLGTFFYPFRPELWALLFATSFVITFFAVIQRIFEKWRYFGRSPSLETLKFTGSVLWVTSTVYFGKRLEHFPKETIWKGTLMGTLFVGNFVFISYRASLTSIFSVPTHAVPFEDLETFLDTNYRLVVRGSQVVEERFMDAGQDEDNHGLDALVWRKKMETGHGVFAKSALDAFKILKEESGGEMALYSELLHFQTVLAQSDDADLACKVKPVWMSPVRTPMSMVVKKGAPYSKVMAMALLRELEAGYYYRELANGMPLNDLDGACNDQKDIFADLRLGLNRIWLMFGVLLVGAVFAAFMLFTERLIMPVGREDVFSEERRKAFRPVLAHLTALESWVEATGHDANSRDDDQRDRELEAVASALAVVADKVDAARLLRKSHSLEGFSEISSMASTSNSHKSGKVFRRRKGGSGVILDSGAMYNLAYSN